MNRFVTVCAAVAALGFAALASAAQGSIDEGIEYKRITPPVPVESNDKVEVVELFWYGCPHCFNFEPQLNRWLADKPAGVSFRRIPAVFANPRWALHARAYYTAEALGVLERVHQPLFDALHVQGRQLNDEAALQAFFGEHGVDAQAFTDTFRSFAVDSKVRRAAELSRRYGIEGVPSMVVQGKYRTEASLAGGHRQMLEVVDFLVQQEMKTAAAGQASR